MSAMAPRDLLHQIAAIIRIENGLFLRDRRLQLAMAAVVLIPAIYVVIFLASVWDPASHNDALPVALVNLDRETRYRDQTFSIGLELVEALQAGKTFLFVDGIDAESARRMVRRGAAAFALVIPEDFSANALPGNEAGAGKIEVYTSEGNSYQAAMIARRFASELSEDMNDRLNQRRWSLVLTAATGSEQSVERLRSAVAILKDGSGELVDGTMKVNRGAQELRKRTKELSAELSRLADRSRELGRAVRTLESRQLSVDDIDQLLAGSRELHQGHLALGKGLAELKGGSARLRGGFAEFSDEAQSAIFVFSDVREGARRMAEGMLQLNEGLQGAIDAQKRLSEGAATLNEKLSLLTEGARRQGVAVSAMSARLPTDAEIDALLKGSETISGGMATLADGTDRLHEGAQRLAAGFELLAGALPEVPQELGGSAEGLSHSVSPVLVVDAPVPNHGNAQAINIIPAALWLGAGIAAFLVNLRVLSRQGAFLPPLAQFVAKAALPAALVVLQGVAVILVITFVLRLSIVNLWAVSLVIVVAALTFLVFVLALTRAFGDVGKVLAILFLALQLSSAGGVMPVELSGGLYAELSPWLPFTWVVKSLKAGMFGAFDGAWGLPLLPVAAAGVLATWLASRVGQWRYVDEAAIHPPIDL